MLIVARASSRALQMPTASVSDILEKTGASKSRAYEIVPEIIELLPSLNGKRGRPHKPPSKASSVHDKIKDCVIEFIMQHPGCVDRFRVRQNYSDAFRRFIIDLRDEYNTVDLEGFSKAVHVPEPTLRDWLRDPRLAVLAAQPPEAPTFPNRSASDHVQMQTVLDAWSRWNGDFIDFCNHVRNNLHIPFGIALIRTILEAHHVRKTNKRAGRSSNERALRESFRTFFPGAQWVGDGMQVPIEIDNKRFVFNLELNVDAHTGAFVGVNIRDEEDAGAVIKAFENAVTNTGKSPIALLLDNKPSNHSDAVKTALGDILLIRATRERPQNKGHVEGAFGLFSQVLPPLVFYTNQTLHDLAKDFLSIAVDIWARTTNHRPRRDRKNLSRFQLYQEPITQEQIELAKRELRKLLDKQERARRTLEARRRPEVLAWLELMFGQLELDDPQKHIRITIAGHSLQSIANGIAIFYGKKLTNALPEGADARYLLGIVKNDAAVSEGEEIARQLLRVRLDLRDHLLAPLVAEAAAIKAQPVTHATIDQIVDKLTETPSSLERQFWTDTFAEVVGPLDAAERERIFLRAVKRVNATFELSTRERSDLMAAMAKRIVPLT